MAQTVLSESTWYKFSVEKEGVYKLTYADLQATGIAPGGIDPSKIAIYGNKGGMLHQLNGANRPFDLQENAIKVVGEDDGIFNQQDYILFYAHGPDLLGFDDQNGAYTYQRNDFARKNYYFLTIKNDPGKRMGQIPDMGSSYPLVQSFEKILYKEGDDINILHSGREWYGRLNSENELQVDLPFGELYSQGQIGVQADVMAQSTGSSSFSLTINGFELGQIPMEVIYDYNNPSYRYTARGKTENALLTTDVSDIPVTGNLELKIVFNRASTALSRGYYNNLLVWAETPLVYEDSQVIYSSLKSTANGVSSFTVSNVPGEARLWNVTTHGDAAEQGFQLTGNTLSFGAISSTLQKYALFEPSKLPKPTYIGMVENQAIKNINVPDLLIVTHPDFLNDASRLGDFRESHNGMQTEVVTADKIYNEFSSGRIDVTAIRDYVKFLYEKSPGKLKYVLLFGRGSYDYLDYEGYSWSFIPIYQSRNSLHPLRTYASDDYFGFLEDNEGEWNEDNDMNHSMEVAVGRLPVTNTEESRQVVDKLISYSSNPETFGDWRTRLLFVADDGDGNLHTRQSEQLSDYVDTTITQLQIRKLYLDNYKQITNATGQESPKASDALQQYINDGALMVNFTGHGNEKQWMHEKILDLEIIESLTNSRKLPVFVTATCEFGRQDDPMIRSGGELMVLHPSGGGIGLVTTSRPVYASSNFYLNKALYQAFNNLQNTPFTLGDIFRETKNNSVLGVNNRNFSLIGDPSLPLSIPKLKVAITNIEELDTLKSLQQVTIRGVISNTSGGTSSWFNGTADIMLTDKPVFHKTKGDEYEPNAPFSYKERSSLIFKGQVTVTSGEFEASFVIPVDIDHNLGDGEFHVYAYDPEYNVDAAASYDLLIGGSAGDLSNDQTGPQIDVYLEDTTFLDGDVVGSDALMLIRLADENGINITGRSLNSDISAFFGDQELILNDYFKSDKDDFRKGWVVYPLEDIAPGEYTLTVTGSDVYNNTTAVTVNFRVTDQENFEIVELINSPNPVLETTEFIFMHNRAGESLEGELVVYDSQGNKILNIDFETPMGQVRHKILQWDCRNANGRKIEPGIYYYHVNLRSKQDGASSGRFQKLIILK